MQDQFAASRFATLLAFFRGGAAGGVVLMFASLAALVLANSPASDAYAALLHLPIGVNAGAQRFERPLAGWVDDALMALFFLLVGLEIRRELTEGQLASLPRAAAPALAALGGMMVPAAIYVAFARHDPVALRGWAIPVATDIAFSLAVLRLLGRRVPVGLRVFLTALAIIDDLGAIVVIAAFYTETLDLPALAAAGLVCAGLFVLARAGVRALGPFMIGFVLLWAALARSGIHPTLAGVAVAFLVPMAEDAEGESPARRLEHALIGWVAYAVLPLFGLVNAGLRFDALPPHLLTSPMVLGIVLGLFVGKQAGVFGVTWLAWRLGLVRLPAQLTLRLLYGAALLCGIGFTMSLFIGHLAFADPMRQAELKSAVFGASLLSALAGLAVLARAGMKAVPPHGANPGGEAGSGDGGIRTARGPGGEQDGAEHQHEPGGERRREPLAQQQHRERRRGRRQQNGEDAGEARGRAAHAGEPQQHAHDTRGQRVEGEQPAERRVGQQRRQPGDRVTARDRGKQQHAECLHHEGAPLHADARSVHPREQDPPRLGQHGGEHKGIPAQGPCGPCAPSERECRHPCRREQGSKPAARAEVLAQQAGGSDGDHGGEGGKHEAALQCSGPLQPGEQQHVIGDRPCRRLQGKVEHGARARQPAALAPGKRCQHDGRKRAPQQQHDRHGQRLRQQLADNHVGTDQHHGQRKLNQGDGHKPFRNMR